MKSRQAGDLMKKRIITYLALLVVSFLLVTGYQLSIQSQAVSWETLENVHDLIINNYVSEVNTLQLMEGATKKALELFELDKEVADVLGKQQDSYHSLASRLQSFFADYYDHKRGEAELIDAALKGMVNSLDIYSSFLPPDKYDDFQMEMEGEYGGIGVVITLRDDRATVVSSFDNTPGGRADINPEDKILAVDGVSTEGMAVDAVANRIRGPEGTKVELEMYRGSEDRYFTVILVREIIQIPFVETEMLDDNIGLIMISQFYNDVGRLTLRAVQDVINQGAEKIILDLRSNPGGSLREAINVASIFSPRGPLLHIKSGEGEMEVINTSPFFRQVDIPLVVLINAGSASGSEIVASALQEYNTAYLIGTQSFGKGTVQTIMPLADGSALRLTTAHFYSAKMNALHEEGVIPDLTVEFDVETAEDEQLEAAIQYLLDLDIKEAS